MSKSQSASATIVNNFVQAMAVLFDQQQRHCVARIVGTKIPVAIQTPTVREAPGSDARIEDYKDKRLSKLPFALKDAQARKQLTERESKLELSFRGETSYHEPVTVRRLMK